MLSNASALDITIAFTLESLLLVGLKVTLGQRLAEMVDFENRKEKGRLYLSNTCQSHLPLRSFLGLSTQPAPSVPSTTFVCCVMILYVSLTGLPAWGANTASDSSRFL